jgi:hypothetical protein
MRRLLSLLLVFPPLVSGCALLGDNDPDAVGNVERETIARHLELAEEELSAGRALATIDRLLPIREFVGVAPEERNRAEALLTTAVEEILERDGDARLDARDLYRVWRRELPQRLRAQVGVHVADRRLEEGHRIEASRMIRQVERELPHHAERAHAGDVLARAGLSLARDERRYALIRRYESRGITALEFLVLTYPLDPHCGQAYAELARIYEERHDLELAVERSEDLVIYHPESPPAIAAEARLPYLRLQRLTRDSYDRQEMRRALLEIDAWLERHPDHELTGWAQEVRSECLRRLAANDLVVAHYYDRIHSPFGARMHAERALEEAHAAGASAEAEEAVALLDILPAADLPAGTLPPTTPGAELDEESP